MNKRVLVLFAHPRLDDRSVANARMLREIRDLDHVTIVDLYATYPTFDIDVDREQEQLVNHDVILFHHPLYWYSTPSILKEWQDLVLEYGFAYGSHGRELEGKLFGNVVTTGGSCEAFTREGYQHYMLRELLQPLEQTATLCHMKYLPPFVLYAAGHAEEEGRLDAHARSYRDYLSALCDNQLDLKRLLAEETVGGNIRDFMVGG